MKYVACQKLRDAAHQLQRACYPLCSRGKAYKTECFKKIILDNKIIEYFAVSNPV